MSSGWLAITKASSLDNSRDWVLNTPCQSFLDSTTPCQRSMTSTGPEIRAQAESPDSTDSRLRFTAKGLPGTVTQAVTKDRAVFISPFFEGALQWR